jgi:peptide/nickel transport system substrate-binding protein
VKKRKLMATVSLVAVFALVAAGCSKNKEPTSSTGAPGATPAAGGTYRTATSTFNYDDGFDPTGEYLGNAWGLYTELLMRNLMTYNHKGAEEGGATVVPDLAVAAPEISADGLTYSFELKTNAMFGPPLDRAVTSHDIEYAFERINASSLNALYGNYYCNGIISGMTCDAKSVAPVSGISTPDDTHIVFTLDAPTGDFLYRLAMPATGAIPEEVAKCFTTAGDYGRYVISSGPYMIMGQDKLDISSCDKMKPIAGFDPDSGMTFVRNPKYDPASDSVDVRANYLDGIQIDIDTNVDDIYAKVQSGELDGTYGDAPPAAVEQKYATDPTLKQYIHSDTADRTWYITMNLLAPPFDDPHIRKAANLIMDKAALAKAFGGSLHGVPATTVEPPTVLPETATYDPYPSTNHAGDLAAAQEEIKLSKYDTDKDGMCDAPECSGFIFLGRSFSWGPAIDQIAVADLAKIGLNANLKETDTGYDTLILVKKLVPISAYPGWGKDFASPFGFDYFIFNSAGIACTGANNYALVGITADQAKECDVEAEYTNALQYYPDGKIPSVDAKMAECVASASDQVNACFADLDKYLMETAVPWVPWSWAQNLVFTSPTVTQYAYDDFSGNISFCHVAVSNTEQPVSVV